MIKTLETWATATALLKQHARVAIQCMYFSEVGNEEVGHQGVYIEGILPKGPYRPCVSMAGRALLAGYRRHIVGSKPSFCVRNVSWRDDSLLSQYPTITVTSHECHRVWSHRQLDWLFNNLFKLPAEKNIIISISLAFCLGNHRWIPLMQAMTPSWFWS